MFREEARQMFYLEAVRAIEQGLLSAEERDTIRRQATRKQGNWVRHLRNLRDYIKYKRGRETCKGL